MTSSEESFLTKTEARQLQASYGDWLTKLKSNEFIHMIYSARLISEYEFERIKSISHSHERNSEIFHSVLMKATYKDICSFRNLLLQARQPNYKLLAKKLPLRESPFDYDQYDYSDDEEVQTTPQRSSQTPTSREHSKDWEMRDEEAERDVLDLEGENCSKGPYSTMLDTTHDYAASKAEGGRNRGGSSKAPVNGQKSTGISRPAARADYSNYQPMLKCYSVKPGNDQQKGKGLCAIMRNFSAELRGYEADSESIKSFFGDTLKYEVVAEDYDLVDMSAAQFQAKLLMLQGMLVNKYDRFVLFVLSHGDEKGIKMCSPSNKKSEETDENGEPVRISVDTIVDYFTHDRVPHLKTFPKCFFFQACQGDQVATPAARSDVNGMHTEGENTWEPPSHKITNKADILVCLPSQKGTYSWVPSTGSWFVQETIAIFRKYYQQEHIVDMMVAVNDALSKREGKGKVGTGSSVIDVYQMPGMACSLTQKFFLAIPPMAPYIDDKKKMK